MIYVCVGSNVGSDGGCDAGGCYTQGQTCTPVNPDNGGCVAGLVCATVTTATGFVYLCEATDGG